MPIPQTPNAYFAFNLTTIRIFRKICEKKTKNGNFNRFLSFFSTKNTKNNTKSQFRQCFFMCFSPSATHKTKATMWLFLCFADGFRRKKWRKIRKSYKFRWTFKKIWKSSKIKFMNHFQLIMKTTRISTRIRLGKKLKKIFKNKFPIFLLHNSTIFYLPATRRSSDTESAETNRDLHGELREFLGS